MYVCAGKRIFSSENIGEYGAFKRIFLVSSMKKMIIRHLLTGCSE